MDEGNLHGARLRWTDRFRAQPTNPPQTGVVVVLRDRDESGKDEIFDFLLRNPADYLPISPGSRSPPSVPLRPENGIVVGLLASAPRRHLLLDPVAVPSGWPTRIAIGMLADSRSGCRPDSSRNSSSPSKCPTPSTIAAEARCRSASRRD
jgi:hypothetical protein